MTRIEAEKAQPVVQASDLEKDERWQLVMRVTGSPAFARSSRLPDLLLYLCERSLQGQDLLLTEQRIAAEVFERTRSFDPTADTIVRSHMLRLRQKLEAYFKEEGAKERLRILIPRGSYVPVFEAVSDLQLGSEAKPASAEPVAAPEKTSEKNAVTALEASRRRLRMISAGLLVACLGLLATLLTGSGREGGVALQLQPMQRGRTALWSSMFPGKSPTLLIAADSGLVMLHGLTGQNSSLSDYMDRNFDRQLAGTKLPRNVVLDVASRRYTSFVDLELFDRLTHAPGVRPGGYSIRYARDVHANDLKNANVILSGSQDANPWIELFEPQMNFVLHNDLEKGERGFLNHAPQAGELPYYQSSAYEYGLLAYMPNLSGSGNALLIEGTAVAGTEAISDFLFEDSDFEPFLEKIMRKDGTLPHFEILLRSRSLDGSASHSEIVAYRTH
ncbi:helix-turn-helix domain-containing protein [Silvibacterium sp.]|uniref:helix-turn-helix domain-containing protein n=1 Tax=Silvibacterium sp. TaxID=1964179 RepID=UPI0039E56F64